MTDIRQAGFYIGPGLPGWCWMDFDAAAGSLGDDIWPTNGKGGYSEDPADCLYGPNMPVMFYGATVLAAATVAGQVVALNDFAGTAYLSVTFDTTAAQFHHYPAGTWVNSRTFAAGLSDLGAGAGGIWGGSGLLLPGGFSANVATGGSATLQLRFFFRPQIRLSGQ